MRRGILFGVITLLLIGCFSSKKVSYDEPRKVAKQKLIPPGTIWLRDSTFIDETEVRNLDYLEFLYWTRRLEPDNYAALLPDTNCWRSIGKDIDPALYYYLRHPAYRDYPVVGINYEQAQAFCKWRADRVNQFLYLQKHREIKNIPIDSIYSIKAPQYVEYRLPSREEWEYASAAGLSGGFNYGYISLTDADQHPVSNTYESWFMRTHSGGIIYSHPFDMRITDEDYTRPVKSGAPNQYGIYNLLGNVSEIIQDTSFKGLNYQTTLDGATMKAQPEKYQRTDSLQTQNEYDYHFTFRYKTTQPWLGFRCVCVVKQIPE